MKEQIGIATFNISGGLNETNRFYSWLRNSDSARKIEKVRESLGNIANFVEEKDIGVLTLQEVDICCNGKERLHQAEYLAGLLSMNFRYVMHSDYSLPNGLKVITGLAFLTKYDIKEARVIDFDQSRLSWLQRLKRAYVGHKKALHCTINVEGKPLNVISAHLTHDHDQQKEYELETLLKYCCNTSPSLLMGDLNTTPLHTRESLGEKYWFYKTDNGMKILARYRDRFQCDTRLNNFHLMPSFDGLLTAPSDKPDKKIDYLLLFSGDSCFSLSQEEVPNISISDHRPVLAQLILNQ